MAMEFQRSVEFSMVDLANIAYYPRIFDLAHRFFEACWPSVCGQDYPHVVQERKLGFPVVQVTSEFLNPLRYGDLITAQITLTHLGSSSVVWKYRFKNQHGVDVWHSTQTTVCVDMDTMKPLAIPDDIRRGMLAHLENEGTP